MKTKTLSGKKIAILVTDGFEQVEFTEPKKALAEVGATVEVVSLKFGKIQGFHHVDRGDKFAVDQLVREVRGFCAGIFHPA